MRAVIEQREIGTSEGETAPEIKGEGRVVLFSRIDARHEQTGAGWQLLHGGDVPGPAWGVAICEAAGGGGFLLLFCGEDWKPISRMRYPTLEEAKREAEFEYEGLESTWRSL